VKWFIIVTVGVFCSVNLVRGDATDLYLKATDAMSHEDYATAADALDQIITNYPASTNIDDVRLRAGFSYMYLGDFTKAIDRLSKEIGENAKPEFRGTALYYTGQAQLFQSGKITDKAGRDAMLAQAATTYTTLIKFINASSRPEDKDLLEDTLYNLALTQFQRESFDEAEKDLLQLLQQYPTSLKRPDYLLLLGSLYGSEANEAIAAQKPGDTLDKIKALAGKAVDAFTQVSNDPNALVQANDANMRKADALFLVAQLDQANTDGYAKALEAYRQVHRKDDMIPLQQKRLDELQAESQQAAMNGGATSLVSENSRLIDRERSRLAELKNGSDPIIPALIRMAECYNGLRQSDEARTILHRLVTVAQNSLTPEQRQEVDFQAISSYVIGGQTAKADAALTDYLTKYPKDQQADIVSYQMAGDLLQKKDYEGALAQTNRSLKDFPDGRYSDEVYQLKAQALNALGRPDDAKKVLQEAANRPGKGAVVFQNLLNLGQTMTAQGDFQGALDAYKKVKDDATAGPLQAIGAAGYIQILQELQRYDDVIAEAKTFVAKYPDSKALPGVLILSGIAMDQKHDLGAIAALQDEAKKYPKDEASPTALSYIVYIYQRDGKIPEMIQAAADLKQAFPEAYTQLAQAADAVSTVYVKQKKFDLALAEYQPLADAPKPEVAAVAHNKMGSIWLVSAKANGSYQSQTEQERAEMEKQEASAEKEYLETLKKYPDQVNAVGDAFQGLVDAAIMRRSWNLLKDADLENYLTTLGADLTNPEMQARLELAKAGLVFSYRDGAKQYPAALERFKKALDANPSLHLTRQEADHFGELLIVGKDYPRAIEVFTALLTQASPNDKITNADGNYGLGAAYLAQGDVAKAKDYFEKMKSEAWHPHILDATYGLALAAEQSGDDATAKSTYAMLMTAPQATNALRAKAMIGYGHLLEKAGHGVKAANQQDIEYAVHYYRQIHTLFGAAIPDLSAEGLFQAGQAYEKAADKADAKIQYTDLINAYSKTAPDWAAKAQDALSKLGA